jgi:hypothetical protein
MELLQTDMDTFPALVGTLPRNVSHKKEKHGLRDRSHERMEPVPKAEK